MVFSLCILPSRAITGNEVGLAVTFVSFAFEMFDRWKAANPNAPDSDYKGFNPNNAVSDSFGGGGTGDRKGFKDFYEKYVNGINVTLGTTILDSDGYVYWQPAFSKFSLALRQLDLTSYPVYFPSSSGVDTLHYSISKSFDGSTFAIGGKYLRDGAPTGRFDINFMADDKCPIDGYYLPFSGIAGVVTGLDVTGKPFYRDSAATLPSDGTFSYYAAGAKFQRQFATIIGADRVSVSTFNASILRPQVKIKPLSGLVDVSSGDYSVDSRVGSLVGDYGILGDNGTIVKSDTQYIFNETNNTVYNPVTGETYSVTNWNYDYSDRSYNMTTNSGNTLNVTYGDEYVTIKEGDTIYNIYYVTNNPTPDPTPDPGGSGSNPDPGGSGSNPGGNTPAPDDGSIWDKLGTLVGSILSGILGFFTALLTKVLDALVVLVDMIGVKLARVVTVILSLFDTIPALFGGFLGFLGAVFPFLPADIMTILTFGIAAVVLVGILKAIRR